LDFSLNNNSGGGALLRDAGVPSVSGTYTLPGISTPTYPDIGISQNPDTSPTPSAIATAVCATLLTTAVPTTGNTSNTVADCLNAARAQGFGKWVVDRTLNTLKLYGPDGTTVVHTFTLDSVTAPTQRT